MTIQILSLDVDSPHGKNIAGTQIETKTSQGVYGKHESITITRYRAELNGIKNCLVNGIQEAQGFFSSTGLPTTTLPSLDVEADANCSSAGGIGVHRRAAGAGCSSRCS